MVVFKASWNNAVVVVKLLKGHSVEMEYSALKHPNIVTFYGTIQSEKRRGVVMEFCPNGTLLDYIKKKKTQVPFSAALKLLTDIARGMQYLHDKKIIHRDLKRM